MPGSTGMCFNWDVFYKRHQDKFFKSRHNLDKEWGKYFSGAGRKVILEVGCGAGNYFPTGCDVCRCFCPCTRFFNNGC